MARRVHLAETGQSFDVGAGQTVLAAALNAGIHLAHDCQLGGCGTCRIKLLDGHVCYAEFPLALTPEEESAGYALACQALPQSDLLISPARAEVELPSPLKVEAMVESVRPLSPVVTGLSMRLPDFETPTYLPGQYMNVILPNGSTRSFSMASKPNSNRVDFHIRRIDGGHFTEGRVSRLQAGEALNVELPLGSFHFRAQDYRPLLMIATGTGLAPIKAILEALMGNPDCPPVSLYWGGRTRADLYLDDQIRRWSERLYDFNYVPVLSRPDGDWNGRTGYVQDAVKADLSDLTEHAIYLCGSPLMISAAKSVFVGCGAAPSFIYTEGFTAQRSQTSSA